VVRQSATETTGYNRRQPDSVSRWQAKFGLPSPLSQFSPPCSNPRSAPPPPVGRFLLWEAYDRRKPGCRGHTAGLCKGIGGLTIQRHLFVPILDTGEHEAEDAQHETARSHAPRDQDHDQGDRDCEQRTGHLDSQVRPEPVEDGARH